MGRLENPIFRRQHHMVFAKKQPDTAVIAPFPDDTFPDEENAFAKEQARDWAKFLTSQTGKPYKARQLMHGEEFVDSNQVRYRHEDSGDVHRLVKIPPSTK